MNQIVITNGPELEIPKELNELMAIMGSMFGPTGDNQFILGGLNDLMADLFSMPPIPTKVTYDPQIKFSYYGKTGYSNGHKGIIIVASVCNEDKGVVHYGTAFCSPKDVYDKAKGKELAYNDLIKNMSTVAFRKKTHHVVNAGIFCDLVASGAYPTWAKKMVAKWTVKHVKAAMLPKKKNNLLGELCL